MQNPQNMTNKTTGISKNQVFKCFDLLNNFFKEKNENFEDLLYRYSIYHLSNFLFFKPIFNNKDYIEGYKSFLLLITDERFNKNTNIMNNIKVFFIRILALFPYKITFLFINKIIILLKKIEDILLRILKKY